MARRIPTCCPSQNNNGDEAEAQRTTANWVVVLEGHVPEPNRAVPVTFPLLWCHSFVLDVPTRLGASRAHNREGGTAGSRTALYLLIL
jgi:hypothetical protein